MTVATGEGLGRGYIDVAFRSLDSGASLMMVVTSREKNSSIVLKSYHHVSVNKSNNRVSKLKCYPV